VTEELKPCPFCGSATAPTRRDFPLSSYVICAPTKSGCGAQSMSKRWEADAIAAWNARAKQ